MVAPPGLGSLRSEFRASRLARWSDLAFFTIFAVGAVALGYVAFHAPRFQPARDVGIAWAIATACALPAPFFLWRNWRKRGLGASLYEGGFAFRDRNGVRSFTWKEIHGVWQKIVRRTYNGIYAGTYHVYTAAPASGPRVVLDSRLISGVEKLGAVLVRESAAHLLPRYTSAFERGERLSFGSLGLDKEGIYRGRRSLPWAAVRSVSVARGYLGVYQTGKWLAFCRVRVADLPNFVVLMMFLERRPARARAQE